MPRPINLERVQKLAREYDERNARGKSNRAQRVREFLTADLPAIKRFVADHGYLRVTDVSKIATWKSPRRAAYVTENSETLVREVTRLALALNRPEAAAVLCSLQGVQFPVASAILQLTHRHAFPILDVRVLQALGSNRKSPYSYQDWLWFYYRMRDRRSRLGCKMRTLDKAYWEWSKQRP